MIRFLFLLVLTSVSAVTGFAATNGIATLDEALAAKKDVWGLAAMRQTNGASYDFFAGLLPPLRYVNTTFHYYPIVLGGPGGQHKARLVSNGSAINAPAGIKTWKDAGIPIQFFVGGEEAPFGGQFQSVDGPHCERGYLPVIRLNYNFNGATYQEEVFGDTNPENDGLVFAKFGGGKITAKIGAAKGLHAQGNTIRDAKGKILFAFDRDWRWDAQKQTLTSHRGGVIAIATAPLDAIPDPSAYAALKKKCIDTWERLLAKAMRLETPERIVNDAWKSTIVGSFLLLKGDRMNYSAGNAYEGQWEAECSDSMRSLAEFGLTNETKKMITPLLDYKKVRGLQFHDASFKLQMLAEYYWLTRDASFVRAQQAHWRPALELIMNCQKSPAGLLPKELSDGDNNLMIDSLSSNANARRGLRDIAAVLEDMGEADEAAKIRIVADALQKAVLAAVAQSVKRSTTPPFIPLALFSHDAPYDPLTAKRLGCYWSLMISYVLGSDIFDTGSEQETWIMQYLQEHGGLCMGMLRIHQHSGLFANDDAVDDLYTLRYADTLLQRDDPERALAGFYGKLAQGMTRETFLSAEGTGLRPLDEFGRSMYLPPISSGDGYFLHLLRTMLVQDYVNTNGQPKSLRLLFATPRRWLEDGKEIRIDHALTAFGDISLRVKSKLSKGEVVAELDAPRRNRPEEMLLRIRLPENWEITSCKNGAHELKVDERGTVDISAYRGKATLVFKTKKLAATASK